MRALVLVNVKTYEEASGERALRLAKAMASAAQESGVEFALAPQLVDLRAVAQANLVPVYAQHVDAVGRGPRTGWVSPRAVREAGAVGTLLNHSEHRLDHGLDKAVEAAKEAGLQVVACSRDAADSERVARLQPHWVAVEPPELIGGDVSVTSADPRVVSDSAQRVRRAAPGVRVLCGAGVKNGRDLAAALELGAEGVLLASGVAKAKDWPAVLRDLASGARA